MLRSQASGQRRETPLDDSDIFSTMSTKNGSRADCPGAPHCWESAKYSSWRRMIKRSGVAVLLAVSLAAASAATVHVRLTGIHQVPQSRPEHEARAY